jgi:hypothetical protein
MVRVARLLASAGAEARDLALGLTVNKNLSLTSFASGFIFSFRFCQRAVNASVKNKTCRILRTGFYLSG